jgi:hypothetical protein
MSSNKSMPPGAPSGSVYISGYANTTNPADTYPTHIDILGRGGYMTVADISERDAIPAPRRSHGMFVFVGDADGAGNPSLFYLLDDMTTWKETNLIDLSANEVNVEVSSFDKNLKLPKEADDLQKVADVVDSLDATSVWFDIPAHSFNVGDIVHNNNGVYELAIANKTQDKIAHGIVVGVDGSKVQIGTSGFYQIPGHGLNLGRTYYTSTSTLGGLQLIPSTTAGTYQQAVIVPVTTNYVLFQNNVIIDNDLAMILED